MIDISKMIEIKNIESSNLDNADELVVLSREALEFLESQSWCKRIDKGYLDRGWGYILGVFLFVIEPIDDDIPTHHWVIVGDIPPAYIDAENNPNGACVIDAYIMEMQKWIDHVKQHQPVIDLIPVNAPPTEEYANMLQERIDVIKTEILSAYKDEIESGLNGVTTSLK